VSRVLFLGSRQRAALDIYALDPVWDEEPAALAIRAGLAGSLTIEGDDAEMVAAFLNEQSNSADASFQQTGDREHWKDANALAKLASRVLRNT
jgi:hypothetical protein